MTDPVKPDDRELERYLEGGSALSRRYRAASRESTPPDLDEAILARARAEARRKPSLNRVLAPMALAASVLLGVNIAWNVWQAQPVPVLDEAQPMAPAGPPPAKAQAAPAGPRHEVESHDRAAAAGSDRVAEIRPTRSARDPTTVARERAMPPERDAKAKKESAAQLGAASGAAAPAAALQAEPARPLSENEKIDRLIAFVGGLQGAVFIRNDAEHTTAEAVAHLQLTRRKAGDRVKTAEDFIRLCASHSYLSREAYLIRFADGRTRTAEDVLREELARLER